MRVALFSDIHGNLEALEGYIDRSARMGLAHHICLGDVVGYGASPNACMERLAALPNLRMVLGNHDAAAIWQASPYEMNPSARKAILWTIDELASVHADRFLGMDAMLQDGDMVCCHANPYQPTGWRYLLNWFHAVRSFRASRGRITFVGHTHRPKVISLTRRFRIQIADPPDDGRLTLDPDARYIINFGALGQPRDGNPNAGFVIYDTQRQTIEFQRFDYDIEGAARRICDAGLPPILADRLHRGR